MRERETQRERERVGGRDGERERERVMEKERQRKGGWEGKMERERGEGEIDR